MKTLKISCAAILLSACVSVAADKLCDVDGVDAEPLGIKEEELTHERYLEALDALKEIADEKYQKHNEITFGIILKNTLSAVEGYALKSKAENDPGGPALRQECILYLAYKGKMVGLMASKRER